MLHPLLYKILPNLVISILQRIFIDPAITDIGGCYVYLAVVN